MDEYHGQFGQDKWLNENLFLNKKGLIFVEIGAAHPIQGSNSYFFEKTLGWNGICIDARKSACDELKKIRLAKVIHAAISDIKRRTIFLECGLFSGLIRYFGKIEYDNIEKFHPNKDNVVAYWVDCVPLAELLEQNSISMVDILMIDTEGAELTILQSITQELINIKVVMTESNDRSSRIEVLDFMRNNNFTFIIGLGMDDVYINNLFISEFNVHPTNF